MPLGDRQGAARLYAEAATLETAVARSVPFTEPVRMAELCAEFVWILGPSTEPPIGS